MSGTVTVKGRTMSWDEAMARAVRLERLSLVVLALAVALVALVSGQSQAMKAAWVEDSLSLLPPLAFLLAARRIRRRPDLEHPYGYHRAVGIGHLVAAVALFTMGAYLLIDSAMGLLMAERAPIGLTVIAGHAVWAGWLMVAAMILTSIPAVLLGRAKMRLAEPLHDKVLFADADMNRADWASGLATVLGVLGIGIGWWWADGAAAIFVSAGIIHDGVRNVRAAIGGLSDRRARTYDDRQVHPLVGDAEEVALAEPWVAHARARVRDQGHVLHAEVFTIPRPGDAPSLAQLVALRERIEGLDWKLGDVVVVPVEEYPQALREAVDPA
ncbi:cation diffusion facilitator family transporter [Brachybacterium nesterenkovii]|uniref:cation diffusion facilitator family transporter n=1 Tax=Brachybacterium nesterenkovii TaxID=47847 RepID=UPI00321AD333